MTEDEKAKWLEGAEEYGSPLEDRSKVPVVKEDDIDSTMSIPGVMYSADPTENTSAKPEGFIQLHLGSLFKKINAMLSTVTDAVSDLTSIKDAAVNATNSANTAASNADDKAEKAITATANAESATSAANTAASNASGIYETVKAWFSPFKTTVEEWFSGRQTEWTTLKGDAVNATQAANTAAENANGKADLANEAADAANTAKKNADDATANANTAADKANTSAANADEKGSYAKEQGDYAKCIAEHPPYIGDDYYWYVWDNVNQTYVKSKYSKGDKEITDDLSDRITVLENAPIEKVESSEASLKIKPNKFYVFGERESLAITLDTPVEGRYNEYMFQFTSPSPATEFTPPEGIRWFDDDPLEPDTDMTYQVSIVDGLAVYAEWEAKV